MRRSLPGTVQAAAAAAAGGGTSAGGDSETSRKRSFTQAGLDPAGASAAESQSSHEPNVTVTPSMMTAIPGKHRNGIGMTAPKKPPV